MAKSFLARRRYTTNGDGGETVRTKARAAIQILFATTCSIELGREFAVDVGDEFAECQAVLAYA